MAYHPQTDGSSEQTNQTVEIGLRFFFHGLDNLSMWSTALPAIQLTISNTFSSAIGKTPNEIAYGFTPRRPLDLL